MRLVPDILVIHELPKLLPVAVACDEWLAHKEHRDLGLARQPRQLDRLLHRRDGAVRDQIIARARTRACLEEWFFQAQRHQSN
jgi:hypothetical protein